MTNEQHAPQPPRARRTPTTRTFHNDVFVDPYEWMRDKESPQLQRFVEEENAYTATRMAHLEPLRERLFDEFKSRVQETDMSVPTRMCARRRGCSTVHNAACRSAARTTGTRR